MSSQVDTKKLLSRVSRLGVNAPEDLLFLMPSGVVDFRTVDRICDVDFNATGFFKLKALSFPKKFSSSKSDFTGFTMEVGDSGGNASLMVPGMAYEMSKIRKGEYFLCTAKKGEWSGKTQLTNITLVPRKKMGSVMAEYPSVKGVVRSDTVAAKVAIAFEHFMDDAVDRILTACRNSDEASLMRSAGKKHQSIRHLLGNLHFPSTPEDMEDAKETIKNLSILEIIANGSGNGLDQDDDRSVIEIRNDVVSDLVGRLEFPLTHDQRVAIFDIIEDLRSSTPMNRMLSGDVGTGKTAAYIIPAMAAKVAGARVAIMVQSFLVASQVADAMKKLNPDIPVIFRAGNPTAKQKRELDEALSGNNPPIVVGTSGITDALIAANHDLDFMIVDEQQKMGRAQREKLKMSHTNYLEATATPIPRSMAILTHGGMSTSFLSDRPVYKDIETILWQSENRRQMMDEIKNVVKSGFQCALIYPVVSENEDEDDEGRIGHNRVRHVEVAYEKMKELFPGKVALLHGSMKNDEKSSQIKSLMDGEKPILIASSVIEIGVTLPSMMMLAVIDPENYGVTTLHQLRGRIDRNGKITAQGLKPKFIMMMRRPMSDKMQQRLNILVRHDDGFMVANEDMNQRGFGDLAGERQSGSTSSVFIGVKIKPEDVTNFMEREEREQADDN